MKIRPLLLILAAAPQVASAVNFTWNGNNADWSSAGEWTPGGPPSGGGGNHAIINSGTANITSNTNPIQDTFVRETGTVNHTAGVHNNASWHFIGDTATSTTANYTISGGTSETFRWYAGRSGGTGTINVSGTGIAKGTDANQGFILGEGAGSKGYLNVTGGSVEGTAEFWVGQGAGGYGEVNVSAGSVSTGNWLAVGRSGATGVVNLSGTGILAHTGANHTVLGSIGGTGTITQTGGTFNNNNDLRLGEGAAGKGYYNMSSGQANVNGWTIVGWNGGALGELNVSGDAYFNSQYVEVGGGAGASGNGTVNLNGGTIETRVISRNGAAISGQVNFNGGTFKAKETNGEFLPGFTNATSEILAGGLVVDTNAFDIATGVALDGPGGLTKTGAGKLTLNGVTTYTGLTTVTAGTLTISGTGAITGGGGVLVAPGAILDGSGSASGPTTITGVLAPGNSIGTLAFGGPLTLDGTTNMEIDRTGAPVSDEANAAGAIDYGGILNVTLLSAPASLQLGDTFDLFDAPSFVGSFDTINLPSLAGLGDGNWYWQDNLSLNGSLTVLPEPGTAALSLFAVAALGRRRRK